MNIGVVFPQVEIGQDPSAIRDYEQALEALAHFRPGAQAQAVVDRLHAEVKAAGRNPAQFGIEGRMPLAQIPPREWVKEVEAWRAMRGISHLCVHTVGLGLKSPAEHVKTLERFKKEALA
jgi:hypothetical protein